jgi:hypothetical protein
VAFLLSRVCLSLLPLYRLSTMPTLNNLNFMAVYGRSVAASLKRSKYPGPKIKDGAENCQIQSNSDF